ncbi:type II toxin-antitoxin system VapB family antitoxin [Brevundimonas sp.]|uniref:type II toxin-antitoxin system VapB family antitoxin n=1 Tax=Brevundimonas sp. TaxID=1871086 RepID=UPI00356738BF
MALNIKDQRTDELARRAAELRQSGITEAVRAALERDVILLEAERDKRRKDFMAKVREIQGAAAAIPDRDTRSLKEISDWLLDDGE